MDTSMQTHRYCIIPVSPNRQQWGTKMCGYQRSIGKLRGDMIKTDLIVHRLSKLKLSQELIRQDWLYMNSMNGGWELSTESENNYWILIAQTLNIVLKIHREISISQAFLWDYVQGLFNFKSSRCCTNLLDSSLYIANEYSEWI